MLNTINTAIKPKKTEKRQKKLIRPQKLKNEYEYDTIRIRYEYENDKNTNTIRIFEH
jgi:hypothetical protein